MNKKTKPYKARLYLINLQKWRSVVGLIACSVTFVVSLVAIVASLIHYTLEQWALSDYFRYFTTLSNMMTALSSSFIIPYAIDGIRKKRFVFPHWLSMFHYAGTIATTMTFVFNGLVILPFDPEFALGGSNFYLHIICPVAVLVSFEFVESGRLFSLKDSLICLIPVFLYTILYLVMVVFIGEEKGGWEDLYMANTFLPGAVSLILAWLMAYFIAFLIRISFNFSVKRRRERLLSGWKDDLEPVEIKIELYGLGRYYGRIGDSADVSIPYDIIEAVSERYSIDIRALLKVYTKGLADGLEND